MKWNFIICFVFLSALGFSQKRGNVWCFGHEAAINFNGPSPVPDTSALISRGSCASICDTNGQLLFYSGYDDDIYSILGPPYQNGEIYNYQHQTMENGDSIVMLAWYYETLIVPYPGNDSLYFVFSTNVTSSSIQGLFYSLVNIKANGGLGTVIQKNIQLLNFKTVDCVTAIKHGNGRDWWVFIRKYSPGNSNNEFYRYLVSPNGISNVTIQTIGTPNSTNNGNLEFSMDGTMMIFRNLMGLLEKFDFDRCTGTFNSPITIFPEQSFTFTRRFWDGQFSPSGRYFYITTTWDTSRLIQYDLQAPDIALSADTLWQTDTITNQFGQLKLAPDNKIYMTTWYVNGFQFPFPYADTMYNVFNSYLSVINQPDSAGISCNFQPYSFYLGGKRTYLGLPNNPDYDLGPLGGSICDTLVNVPELNQNQIKPNLFVYYSHQWNTAFINADKLTESDYLLSIYDLNGKEIFHETGSVQPPYFTKNFNCTGIAKGVYFINFKSGKVSLTKKFIIE